MKLNIEQTENEIEETLMVSVMTRKRGSRVKYPGLLQNRIINGQEFLETRQKRNQNQRG